jgi:hypothetical protein
MAFLEFLGLVWIIGIVLNFLLGFLVASRHTVTNTEEAAVQQRVDQILASGLDIKIEIIKFDDATIYYAYLGTNKKFLTQGASENEVLDTLAKKYGAATKFNIISREYVGTTYN